MILPQNSMKKATTQYLILFAILALNLLSGCKEEIAPVLTTNPVTEITGISAKSGGAVVDDGGTAVISYGVCWSTKSSPTTAEFKTNDGSGVASFSSSLTELNGSTIYYVRAYATNSVGIGYGNEVTFTTLATIPSGTSEAATNLTASSATLNGIVNANNYSTTVTFEYGTTTNYGNIATAKESPLSGDSNTNVSADISGLVEVTTYHYRVKAVNSYGTTYSTDKTFTTLGQIPTSATIAATNITSASATLNGTVNANYLNSTVTFEYGLTTNYGSTVNSNQSPVSGNTITDVNAIVSGLDVATTYHYRVKATNSLGTSYGSDMSFKTLSLAPSAITHAPTNITPTSATLNGSVNSNGENTTVTFEYGTTTEYGSSEVANQSPFTGNISKSVSVDITGLTKGLTYHYRIIATNSLGTIISSDLQFVADYIIGQNSAGGIVFYVDNTGLHGLVSAPSDQGSYPWGCEGTRIGGTSVDFGSGLQNTDAIVAKCSGSNAANICNDLVLNGYSDWYLPSLRELVLIHDNLYHHGIGDFSDNFYWSSSEWLDPNTTHAFGWQFLSHQENSWKSYALRVRAIRAF